MEEVWIDVAVHAACDGLWGRGTASHQKPKDQEGRPSRSKRAGEGEGRVECKRQDKAGFSTKVLTERTEYQGPDDIADKEDGYRQGDLLTLSDMEGGIQGINGATG